MARKRTYHIELSDEQVKVLKKQKKSHKTSSSVSTRCSILLDLDEKHGKLFTHEQAATRSGCSMMTVHNTVKLYATEGFDSVLSLKRNINSDNSRRKVDGRAEARLVELACGPVPEGHSRWTLRLLEEKSKVILEQPVKKDAIGKALKKTKFDLTRTNTGASHPKKVPNS